MREAVLFFSFPFISIPFMSFLFHIFLLFYFYFLSFNFHIHFPFPFPFPIPFFSFHLFYFPSRFFYLKRASINDKSQVKYSKRKVLIELFQTIITYTMNRNPS